MVGSQAKSHYYYFYSVLTHNINNNSNIYK